MKKSTCLPIILSVLAALAPSCYHLEIPDHGEQADEKDHHVQMIKVSKDTVDIINEFSYSLKAFLYPEKSASPEVEWTSLNEKVVTVDGEGLVQTVSVGQTKVVAKSVEMGVSDTCVVNVLENIHVESVMLDHTDTLLYLGSEMTLKATVLPENARIPDVEWTSSAPEIATVDDKGVVKPVSEGTAEIVVTSVDGGKTATCTVTVSRIAVTGISLNKTNLDITLGGGGTLRATITPSNATYQTVKWESSDPSVATVDNGSVSAVALGTAVITVTTDDGGYTAQCVVNVKEASTTKTISLVFDLTTCPESMASYTDQSVGAGVPNGMYAIVANDGKSYDFELYRGSSNHADKTPYYDFANSYFKLGLTCYLGMPIIPGGTLKTITFTQSAPTTNYRKSSVASTPHDGNMSTAYYDASIEGDGKSLVTGTKGADYTFTIKNPEPETMYYLVCGQTFLGISRIVLTYDVVVSPITLSFDFSGTPLPGWPTANHTHTDGGDKCIYPLDGVDYTFVLADCNGASTCTVFWDARGYLLMNSLYRYIGFPALEGYKLTRVVAVQAASENTKRKVGIANQIEAMTTHPESAKGHGYAEGGELQTWAEKDKEYIFDLTNTIAGKVYYLYAQSTATGVSTVTLTYNPE